MVKVVRCPVKVGEFVTRLYFLEIHHSWNYAASLRGYFVFINKFRSPLDTSRQPLQLLMYVEPDNAEFPEMMPAGREATLRNSLDSVSSRTMKIRLRELKPLPSFSNPILTGMVLSIIYKNIVISVTE